VANVVRLADRWPQSALAVAPRAEAMAAAGNVAEIGSVPIFKQRRGHDTYKRARRGLDGISPSDKRLGEALAYWHDLREGGRLPARSQIDLFQLKTMMGWMHVVDTTAGNPDGYFYRLWGSNVRLDSGKDHTRMPLGGCPWPLLRDAAMQDYADVVATGQAAYHLISHTVDHLRHSFARLLLPLAADGRRVDQLLILINERPLPCIEQDLT
jgi:hypothetical protein